MKREIIKGYIVITDTFDNIEKLLMCDSPFFYIRSVRASVISKFLFNEKYDKFPAFNDTCPILCPYETCHNFYPIDKNPFKDLEREITYTYYTRGVKFKDIFTEISFEDFRKMIVDTPDGQKFFTRVKRGDPGIFYADKNSYYGSFDFASLYPSTMIGISGICGDPGPAGELGVTNQCMIFYRNKLKMSVIIDVVVYTSKNRAKKLNKYNLNLTCKEFLKFAN